MTSEQKSLILRLQLQDNSSVFAGCLWRWSI